MRFIKPIDKSGRQWLVEVKDVVARSEIELINPLVDILGNTYRIINILDEINNYIVVEITDNL